MKTFIWKVSAKQVGARLVNFVRDQLPSPPSLRQLKKNVERGALTLNGKTVRVSSTKLQISDRIIFRYEARPLVTRLILTPEHVLYEDEHLFAINKPAAFSSTSSSKYPDVFSEMRRTFFKNNSYCALLHRLDRDTSGVLLSACSKTSEVFFLEQFKGQKVQKTYRAIVWGVPKKKEATLTSHLGVLQKRKGFEKWGLVSPSKGKKAITRYKVLKSHSHSSELELYPLTGRTHQIRVQLSEMGHPILGDWLYGEEKLKGNQPSRHLLHAHRLKIPHPARKAPVEIEAPLPKEFFFKG